jgi:glutathione S-transferase
VLLRAEGLAPIAEYVDDDGEDPRPVLEAGDDVIAGLGPILIYLASRSGSRLWPSDPAAIADVVGWTSWLCAVLQPTIDTALHRGPIEAELRVAAWDALDQARAHIEAQLRHQPFLARRGRSVADVLAWASLREAGLRPIQHPATQMWSEDMSLWALSVAPRSTARVLPMRPERSDRAISERRADAGRPQPGEIAGASTGVEHETRIGPSAPVAHSSATQRRPSQGGAK